MPTSTHTIPRIAIQSIGGGLLLMTFFTIMWVGIACGNLAGITQYAVIFVFGVPCGMFMTYALSLFRAAKYFPPLTTEDDKAEGKKMGIWYGIIFGAEGVTIPVVSGLLAYFQQTQYILPGIALVVGLHFYPMGRVFHRTIDYYLATWATLVAVGAILCIMYKALPQNMIYAALGIGIAMATTGYGLYMMYEGKRMISEK
jgi:hypothetical protein